LVRREPRSGQHLIARVCIGHHVFLPARRASCIARSDAPSASRQNESMDILEWSGSHC
jgi:hypothetical protein